jgi:diguanylate cyclase (GGDEF)-like protein
MADDPAPMAHLTRFAPHALLALARGRAYAEMMELAYSDPLTGLANSRALQAALNRTAAAANADGQPLALLIIDLDDFRRYNTNWGHLVGDAALQAFARALRTATRSTDFVARIGGEEFAVLLQGADAAGAAATLRRLAGVTPEGQTCSGGVAAWDGVELPDALMRRADGALYAAKRAGRDRVVAYAELPGSDRELMSKVPKVSRDTTSTG